MKARILKAAKSVGTRLRTTRKTIAQKRKHLAESIRDLAPHISLEKQARIANIVAGGVGGGIGAGVGVHIGYGTRKRMDKRKKAAFEK